MHGVFGRGRLLVGRTAIILALCLLVSNGSPARADGYPDRTVKIIVPFPAGGTADAVPRLVAERLSRKWGQPVVIENRTGAAGNIGAEAARQSASPIAVRPTKSRPCLHIPHMQNSFPRLIRGFVVATLLQSM